MKRTIFLLVSLAVIMNSSVVYGQQDRNLQFFRATGFQGIDRFETGKEDTIPFSGLKVRVGGDLAMQFQGIDHKTGSQDTLVSLGYNFNLPTANLNIDVQLADGVRMSLVTYLSSRHHPEAWVKGGYIQFDKLDFIREGFLEKVMNVTTVKIGLDEINYGDAHFRRSDNARAIYNPFVGNFIMDGFTTEAFGELTLQSSGFLCVFGLSNGKLNQSPVNEDIDPLPSVYGKAGFDKEINEDLRTRFTASFYLSPGYDNGQYLYQGDRTGARYYAVMQPEGAQDDFRSGRFSPAFRRFSSYMANAFVRWKGLELFGLLEYTEGDRSEDITGGNYTQAGAELLYRFGKREQLYIGGRYNWLSGYDAQDAMLKTIDRINVGGGWFFTNNILMKAEYVSQRYDGDGFIGTVFQGGMFQGVVVEAVIGF